MSTTIRVEDATKRRVRALAEATGMKMQAVVEEAVAQYERKVFWERTNARYAELREDREEWAGISDERDGESGALRDASG
jgi:predicted transcriptional regulator